VKSDKRIIAAREGGKDTLSRAYVRRAYHNQKLEKIAAIRQNLSQFSIFKSGAPLPHRVKTPKCVACLVYLGREFVR